MLRRGVMRRGERAYGQEALIAGSVRSYKGTLYHKICWCLVQERQVFRRQPSLAVIQFHYAIIPCACNPTSIYVNLCRTIDPQPSVTVCMTIADSTSTCPKAVTILCGSCKSLLACYGIDRFEVNAK